MRCVGVNASYMHSIALNMFDVVCFWQMQQDNVQSEKSNCSTCKCHTRSNLIFITIILCRVCCLQRSKCLYNVYCKSNPMRRREGKKHSLNDFHKWYLRFDKPMNNILFKMNVWEIKQKMFSTIVAINQFVYVWRSHKIRQALVVQFIY